MIIVIKQNADEAQVENLKSLLLSRNITPHVSKGSLQTIIGCVGDVAHLDPDLIEALDVVESVQRIQEPYKSANRKFHPEDTVVEAGGVKIGGGNFAVVAGPCSVESEEQVVAIARAVKAAGASMLRGGAFKPRTSPYAFKVFRTKLVGFDDLKAATHPSPPSQHTESSTSSPRFNTNGPALNANVFV